MLENFCPDQLESQLLASLVESPPQNNLLNSVTLGVLPGHNNAWVNSTEEEMVVLFQPNYSPIECSKERLPIKS